MNESHRKNLLVLSVLALGLVFSGLADRYMDPYYRGILISAGINAILAVSLTLINGITGQFSIGHAAFMGVGAYAAGALTARCNLEFMAAFPALPAPVAANLWLLGALILGGLAAAVAGLLIGIPTLRLRGDYLAIATLGFGQIVVVLINNMDFIGGPRGMSLPTNPDILQWIVVVLVVCVAVIWRGSRSPRGLALSAVREDEIASVSVGIDTTRAKVTAFAVGAFFAGVAGGLFAHQYGYINPSSFQFIKSFEVVMMIVLGGMGSLTGAIIGAVILTVLPELLRASSEWRLVIYSVLLIALMILRPQGIFGRQELHFKALRGLIERLRNGGGRP